MVVYPLGREAWRRGVFAANKLEAEPDAVRTAKFESMREELAKVRIALGITVPGRIVSRSPEMPVSRDLRGVVASFDHKALKSAADFERAMAPRLEIIFCPVRGSVS